MSREFNYFTDCKAHCDQYPRFQETGYYIKETPEDGSVVRIPITNENVFTYCPRCGQEFQVNDFVNSYLNDRDFDLYGTALFCHECSAELFAERNKQ